MPDNKDELLKQQNEEIQKLKKELKAATKPSSMLSVLKNTVKRNVHEFFIREDKIKSVQEENKKLKKELEETKEERDKTSAQLFAAINLGSDNQERTVSEEGTIPDDCETPVFPQTAEEAVREYFGPVDLAALARQLYPDQSMQRHDTASCARAYQTRAGFQTPTHASNYLKTDGQLKLAAVFPPVDNPEPEITAPSKIKDIQIIQEYPDSSEEKSAKQDLPDNQPSEREDGPMQEDINEAPSEDDLPDLAEPPEDLPDISGGSVWDMEEPPTEPQAEPEAIQMKHTEEPAEESLKESSKELPKKTPKKPAKEPSLPLTKAEEKSKQAPKIQEKKIEKSDSGKKITEKHDAAEQQNQPEKIKEKQTEPPKTKPQARLEPQQNENPTATVIDKNGKRKSKKDKRKNQQQRQEPEIKQEQPKIIPMEQPPKEVELPDDFGIVMEPEEPEPIELPDPNENNRNIFDEIFNSDSDNWDDSNI